MIKLEVNFSQEYEVQRILETIHRLDFYREHKYNVRLPEKLIANPNINISENQIIDAVKSEYKEDDYIIQKIFLIENWQKTTDEASVELSKTDLKLLETYTINLTKYGVGGSYHYPDVIVANIKNSYSIGLLRTVFHEILHLAIHSWIDENKIGHWQKERIIDLLMTKIIPKLSKPQQIPIQTENIDKVFSDNYPNIKTVIKKLV